MVDSFIVRESNGIPYVIETMDLKDQRLSTDAVVDSVEVKVCVAIPLGYTVEWESDILPTETRATDSQIRYVFYVRVTDVAELGEVIKTIDTITAHKLKSITGKFSVLDRLQVMEDCKPPPIQTKAYRLDHVLDKELVNSKYTCDSNLMSEASRGAFPIVNLAKIYLLKQVTKRIAKAPCNCLDILKDIEVLCDIEHPSIVIKCYTQHMSLCTVVNFDSVIVNGDYTLITYFIPDMNEDKGELVKWMQNIVDGFIASTCSLLNGRCTHGPFETPDIDAFTKPFIASVTMGIQTAIDIKSPTLNKSELEILDGIEISTVVGTNKVEDIVNLVILSVVLKSDLLPLENINFHYSKHEVTGGVLKLHFDLANIESGALCGSVIGYVSNVLDSVFPPKANTLN